MKKKIFVLFVCIFICACSNNVCYQVLYNGELVEERYYENDALKSIVIHNCTDTKDSIVYDDSIKGFYMRNNKYIANDSMPFYKYYYQDFDMSLRHNEIYSYVGTQTLLEGVLWSLASFDNEVKSSDNIPINKRKIIRDSSNLIIEYQDINTQCLLHGLFETYNTEKLKSVKMRIRNKAIVELLFLGENIDKKIIFEYSNGILFIEKIYYYNSGEKAPCYYEEYRFRKKEISS